MIGDCQAAALVSRSASIDWLCLPRFDSGACFAALLGNAGHGRWKIAPLAPARSITRRYRPGTLVLETSFSTDEGRVTVVDFMPIRDALPNVVRIVVGDEGRVRLSTELILRLDYGSIVPWVRRADDGIRAIAGPERISLHTGVPLHGRDLTTVGEFSVSRGDRVPFCLSWHPSYEDEPFCLDAEKALEATEKWWREWSGRCEYTGPWKDHVVRSLVTLKALSDSRTGGIVAAPTTSLPEKIGGVRNWDYRYCWLRDATFTLYALMQAGYSDEARDWREWLLRAAAGEPSKLQIMYGVDGARRLTELEIPWLPGYEKSAPVRIGNAASSQLQLDVYGELMDAMHQCYRANLEPEEAAWRLQRALLGFLEKGWHEPDQGIWEVRGPQRHFTHSKVMAWVAVDRAIKSAELGGFAAPLPRWRALREEIHAQACLRGYDPELKSFVQSYGSKRLDASLLRIPLVGFLPWDDERVRGTVAAIEKHLMFQGLLRRYLPDESVEGLPDNEGVFLPCSFWLCDNMVLAGRHTEARALFERLIGLENDVGLMSEEYDPEVGRLVGNFPQAFSHVAIIISAMNLGDGKKGQPAASRGET